MNQRLWTVVLVGVTLVTCEGCRHQCRRPFTSTCPPRCGPTCPTPGGLPPAALHGAPPPPAPAATLPPAPAASFPATPTPATDSRSFSPPAPLPNWGPAQGSLRPIPEVSTAEPPRDSVRLQPPVSPEPPLAPTPPAVTEERLLPTPSLPVGIPQFAAAKERVTSGLKPALDGFEWLQANGYRTVLHLRGPRDGDNADRKLVEKYGMKYVSIEVTPQTLQAAVEDFNRILSEPAAQPMFVYDRDGTLAGSMWYLHFRMVDRLSDDAARRKAAALGLKEETTGEAGTLWLAIQEYLRKNLNGQK